MSLYFLSPAISVVGKTFYFLSWLPLEGKLASVCETDEVETESFLTDTSSTASGPPSPQGEGKLAKIESIAHQGEGKKQGMRKTWC